MFVCFSSYCVPFFTEKAGSMSGDSGHGSSQTDAYDELFHTHNTLDLDPLDNEQEEAGNKVSYVF